MPIMPDCLFCDDVPCATHADKPKKAASSKKKSPAPAPVAFEVPIAPPASEPDFIIQPKVDRFANRAGKSLVLSEDDLIFREAVRNLWDILDYSTQHRYMDLVRTPRTPAQAKRHSEVRRMLDGTAQ